MNDRYTWLYLILIAYMVSLPMVAFDTHHTEVYKRRGIAMINICLDT